jgi:predicted Rossmann fold flavoprotein
MENEIFDLVVIGGGAAGYFGAIITAERNPELKILILEKTTKVLAKVKVSGGGRCNVTHNCFNPFQLADHYPRGEKVLKSLFKSFHAEDMVKWLRGKGVELKAEGDGRMFPVTDDSQTIIECFVKESSLLGIRSILGVEVNGISVAGGALRVLTSDHVEYTGRNVLVATGGSAKKESYHWLEALGHKVARPIPSLFTFNDSQKYFVELMGVSVPSAEVKVIGTKFSQRGPILITHWGLSGPAVIKLSAWAAVALNERNYEFTVHVNWTTVQKEDEMRATLIKLREATPKQKVFSNPLFGLPVRLWEKLCAISEIEPSKLWGECPNKNINKLVENLYRSEFIIRGKTTFKEEFVTCGGIELGEVDLRSMESKKVRNLYFAGEVLNLDGETGGFNFQAAWTTAFVAATAIAKKAPAGVNQQEP